MRTTVDLPAALHRRVRELAHERGQSMSAVLAQLAAQGLEEAVGPRHIRTDPRSGFPVISLGRTVTAEEVTEALDEE